MLFSRHNMRCCRSDLFQGGKSENRPIGIECLTKRLIKSDIRVSHVPD